MAHNPRYQGYSSDGSSSSASSGGSYYNQNFNPANGNYHYPMGLENSASLEMWNGGNFPQQQNSSHMPRMPYESLPL
ncbi:unnamed protein product, partial [Allacma fusca]